ncbi:MAG: AarF/UbiB family protein [Solirubrobacteraceae bacterium]
MASHARQGVAARAIELLRAMGGLAGKTEQAFELVPEDARPRGLPARPEPLPLRRVRGVLEEEWDEDVDEVVAELSAQPVALASAGQVHRAVRLRDDAAVAVKVQRPGAAEAARADLGALATLARLGSSISPRLDTGALADELRSMVLEELDHELEAQRQRAFARAYRGHPFIHVPAPDTRLSTQRVLVSEWVDGRSAAEIVALDQAERDRVAEALLRFFLGSPFRAGLVHADPHPGNWLLGDDGRVAVLDYGAAGQLERERVAQTIRVYVAGAAGDAAAAHAGLDGLGYLPDAGAIEPGLLLDAALAMAGWWVDRDRIVRVDRALLAASAEGIRTRLAPLLDAIVVPPEDLLLRRVEVTLPMALAPLEPELPWGAIGAEWWAGGAPAGRLGAAEEEFWNQRG